MKFAIYPIYPSGVSYRLLFPRATTFHGDLWNTLPKLLPGWVWDECQPGISIPVEYMEAALRQHKGLWCKASIDAIAGWKAPILFEKDKKLKAAVPAPEDARARSRGQAEIYPL